MVYMMIDRLEGGMVVLLKDGESRPIPLGIMKLSIHAAAFCASLFSSASATIFYAGVAESGGEFGVWSATSTPGTGLPGTFGVEYAFIKENAIDTMVDQHKVRNVPLVYAISMDIAICSR